MQTFSREVNVRSRNGSEGSYPFNKFQLNNCLRASLVEDILSRMVNFREGQPLSMFTVPTDERIRIKYPRCLQNIRGTQRIVSVNYLFERPLIPHDFLKEIFFYNFRDMGNLRSGVFGLIKMSSRVPRKGQLRFSERK